MADPTYAQILSQLDGTSGLVRRPLSEQEIADIERQIGIAAPSGVRAWLGKVGLFQDVGTVDACEFELRERVEDLVLGRRDINQILGQAGADLFPFGHDGAGDEIAVRGDELVFVDHETGTTRVMGSLRTWMADVVAEAVKRAKEEPDVQKFWCVQFAFQTRDEKPILDALRTVAPVTIPDQVWDKKPVSSAGVASAKLGFAYMGQARLLSRMTYKGWTSPHYSFNYEEPATLPVDQSMIRRLDELFRSRPELNYKLVDYGPLEWPLDEKDDEPDTPTPQPAAGKAWWKFW